MSAPPQPQGPYDDQAEYQSFLLRIWRGSQGWQGELYSLQSDRRLAFVGLRQLASIIRRSLVQAKRPAPRADIDS